ncbi:hypothetical protein KJZ99_06125 [bacterium]|nr:hypothetical protein [bacterium]
MRISLDDILIIQQKGTPVLNPMQKGGLCEVCRHRAPSMIPPALNLRHEQSVRQYLRWYMKQDKSALSYKDMDRARLCAFVLKELDTADKYLFEWILAKARISLKKLEKLEGNPVEFIERERQKLLPDIKQKWPELSDEEVQHVAKAKVNEAVCELLEIETPETYYPIYRLREEWDFLGTFRQRVVEVLIMEWKLLHNFPNLHTLVSHDMIGDEQEKAPVDLLSLDCEISMYGLWNAHDQFVHLLLYSFHMIEEAPFDELDSYHTWDWLATLDRINEFEIDDTLLTTSLNVAEAVLIARLCYLLHPERFTETILCAAARSVAAYILYPVHSSSLISDPLSYLAEYGFVLEITVEDFLLGQVQSIARSVLSNETKVSYKSDLAVIRESLESLLVAVRSKPELARHVDTFGALIDIFRNVQELSEAKSQGEEDAILADFETAVLQVPEDPIEAVLRYLPDQKEESSALSYELGAFLDKFYPLTQILNACTAQSLSTTPRSILSMHPRYRELGRKAGARALEHGVSKELRRRIYDHWPELSVPHIVKTLEGLKGLGHDFSLTVFQRLIESQHYMEEKFVEIGSFSGLLPTKVFSDHNVRMVDIGERLATLERAMRAKLRDLFSDNPKVLESSELWSERNWGEIQEREKMFKTNMRAIGVKICAQSFADFANFSDLAFAIRNRVASPNREPKVLPCFKSTEHKYDELNAAISRVRAFRNAWAHHAPIESGFEKFDESYNYVLDWVNSLEKLEQ